MSTNEDNKPRGQPIIETSSVKDFYRRMGLALNLRNQEDPMADDSLIVVIHGNSGLGKTFAIRGFLEKVSGRTLTGLPIVVKIVIKQNVSPKGLAKQILDALGERPRGREFYDLIDEVVDTIEGHRIAMMVFDEADRLNEETFEFLRSVVDATQRPIALVGLPSILKVIRLHTKFRGRVAMRIPFKALNTEEFLDTFLPQLNIPRWIYDPADHADREMGLFLWERLRPVLRRVRKILRIASSLAMVDGVERITMEQIREAFSIDADMREEDNDENENDDEERGEHEDESERRQDLKRKPGRRRKRDE